jgi:predicted GH43/DUF377 family glycosyl hydrolase
MEVDGLARRSSLRMEGDPSRVVTCLFVPGQEGFDQQESRSSAVMRRLLALSDADVEQAMDDLVKRFEGRHLGLMETFSRHADELSDRLDAESALSPTRRLLLGATFTSEYAVEGAALCNPSMVVHPDQSDVADGHQRIIMSVRGIGEGHRSSIGFRTGQVDPSGDVSFDPTPSFAVEGRRETSTLSASALRGELRRLRGAGDDADFVLSRLGSRFSHAELEKRINLLEEQGSTRQQAARHIALIRGIADRTYRVCFESTTSISERVLLPAMAAESRGMEDARFVRFVQDDGVVTYYATYTAYNGTDIGQQLLATTDFAEFTSAPLAGASAANKGLALFPRRIEGRYAALSRSDRESNSVAFSDDLHHWESSSPCQVPVRSWEMLQLGNCGSPIETDAGWLVLTHGVGPMRTYNIGVMLLDLRDPTKILGQLDEPLLSPQADEQDGYVPNVVYSCGAMVHRGTLVIPYGIGDAAIGMATVPLDDLLEALQPHQSEAAHLQRQGDTHA